MVTDLELAKLRKRIFKVAYKVATPYQLTYFDLAFDKFLSIKEIEACSGGTINNSLANLKNEILEADPYLSSAGCFKYKGAARMLKLIAVKCNRGGAGTDQPNYSYTTLFDKIQSSINEAGTQIQKETFGRYFYLGESQNKIAGDLGVIQPTVHKTIFGNYDLVHKKHYGGIINKAGKRLRKDAIPYCCHLINPYGSLFRFVFGG